MSLLINKVIKNEELIADIEKENDKDIKTLKRYSFYNRLGFKKIPSEYLFYDVLYTPIVYSKDKKINKEEYDNCFYEYYKRNCGEKQIVKNFKKIF